MPIKDTYIPPIRCTKQFKANMKKLAKKRGFNKSKQDGVSEMSRSDYEKQIEEFKTK